MNMLFDPLNLVLLGIAIVVFWRLRGVLGSRTGTERPPFDPYRKADPAPEAANGNVVRLPREDQPAPARAEPPPPPWTGYAPEGSPLAQAITRLAETDTSFTPKAFLDGACLAYEMILEAFARGDKGALKDLLSRDVLAEFGRTIDQRQSSGQRLDWRFVGIEKTSLLDLKLQGKRAEATVRFDAEAISATYGRDGALIDGDAKEIRALSDVWTFERDVSAKDPNWKLTATQVVA
jgi:predicted lipid-binding transport protein (Tim44 family)